MQFTQIFASLALAVATTTAVAIPTGPSFDDTLAKIKLAHRGISDDEAHTSAVRFLSAMGQLKMEGTRLVSPFPLRLALSCTKKATPSIGVPRY